MNALATSVLAAALSLNAPQPGSTAAAGNGIEGLYVSPSDIVFVSAAGDIAAKFAAGTLWGSISVQGSKWSFDAGTRHHFVEVQPVTGAGAFVPRRSMSGSHAQAGRAPEPFGPYRYAHENALAVSQAGVAGTWTNPPARYGMGLSIEVDARGAFTGRTAGAEIGRCQVLGTIEQLQPGSAKNMFRFELVATAIAGSEKERCQLPVGEVYGGPAAIVLSAAHGGEGSGLVRNILFLVRTAAGDTLSIALGEQSEAADAAAADAHPWIFSRQ